MVVIVNGYRNRVANLARRAALNAKLMTVVNYTLMY